VRGGGSMICDVLSLYAFERSCVSRFYQLFDSCFSSSLSLDKGRALSAEVVRLKEKESVSLTENQKLQLNIITLEKVRYLL